MVTINDTVFIIHSNDYSKIKPYEMYLHIAPTFDFSNLEIDDDTPFIYAIVYQGFDMDTGRSRVRTVIYDDHNDAYNNFAFGYVPESVRRSFVNDCDVLVVSLYYCDYERGTNLERRYVHGSNGLCGFREICHIYPDYE